MNKMFMTLVAILIPTMAFAGSAHFIKPTAWGPDDAGSLLVSFKIAGLGDAVSTTVVASAGAEAVYACMNGGGNFPEDPKKESVVGPVSAADNFTSGKNGQITGSLLLTPPPSSLECPPGQDAALVAVSYRDVEVFEPAAGSESIPGSFSAVYYDL